MINMSNIKKRFRHPTGIEYFDNAMEIDLEIWSFVKKEFKNKSRKDVEASSEEMNSAPEGCIPYRYWDTHGKILHNYAWELIRIVRLMYQIPRPQNQKEVDYKKKLAKTAIGWCWNIHDALDATAEELPMIDIDKLDNAFELITKEINLLEGVAKKAKISSQKDLDSSVQCEQ